MKYLFILMSILLSEQVLSQVHFPTAKTQGLSIDIVVKSNNKAYVTITDFHEGKERTLSLDSLFFSGEKIKGIYHDKIGFEYIIVQTNNYKHYYYIYTIGKLVFKEKRAIP